MKYIGQDKARGRIAQWITQACLERDWRLLKGWVVQGEGVTALYNRLLLSCRVGLRVGGGGTSGGEGRGDYVTVLQTYAWWCKETPHGLKKVKGRQNSSREAEIINKHGENEVHRFTITAFYTLDTPCRHAWSQPVHVRIWASLS